MIGFGLRQLEELISARADTLQREFIDLSAQLNELGRELLELRDEERQAARLKQKEMRAQQQVLAEEINVWRERARGVLHQPGQNSLLAFLEELEGLGFKDINLAIEHSRLLMEAGGEGAADEQAESLLVEQTPVQRLLERARTNYILRGADVAVREREAVTFANQAGTAQDDKHLTEIMAALDDPDPLVREVAFLTTIQMLRFRAVRLADLDEAHLAVKKISKLNHPAAVSVLIEVLENPRSGFRIGDEGPTESENNQSRMVALLRLVEWHTADAEQAVRNRLRDRDAQIVKVAKRALDLFPAPWAGPLKKQGSSTS